MAPSARSELPDLSRIADALARHQVDYLLVGGLQHGPTAPTA